VTDLYHQIYNNEIFQLSRCIWQENSILDFLRTVLISQGYVSIDSGNKVWKRKHRTVAICLVDDYTTCAQYPGETVSRMFDRDTVVVTDNYVLCPTRYSVLTLPKSFVGIYAHSAPLRSWNPQRRFTFAVNRIDIKRMLLLLEIVRSSYTLYADPTNLDFINFNCWAWEGDNSTQSGLQQNFQNIWNQLEPHHVKLYEEYHGKLIDCMPLRNHDMTLEESYHASGMNVVIETYSGESVIALSEKTFAALCSAAPWALYAGRYAVSYLASLGFDTLVDLFAHQYDGLVENGTFSEGDRIIEFVCESRLQAHNIQSANRDRTSWRLQQAAEHNRRRLYEFRTQWAQDFAQWLPQFVAAIG
jgi:hypothetical protein